MFSQIAGALLREGGVSALDLWALIGVVVVPLLIVWGAAKATSPPGHIVEGGDMARGTVLLALLMIFVAATLWAWRYLFG